MGGRRHRPVVQALTTWTVIRMSDPRTITFLRSRAASSRPVSSARGGLEGERRPVRVLGLERAGRSTSRATGAAVSGSEQALAGKASPGSGPGG